MPKYGKYEHKPDEPRCSKKWPLTHEPGAEGFLASLMEEGSQLRQTLEQAEKANIAKEVAEAVYADFESIAHAVQSSLDKLHRLPPLPFQEDELRLRRALRNLKSIAESVNLWSEGAEVEIPKGRRKKGLYF